MTVVNDAVNKAEMQKATGIKIKGESMSTPLALVLNCGSSSVKFAVLAPSTEEMLISGLVEKIGSAGTRMVHKLDDKKIVTSIENASYEEILTNIFKLIEAEPEWINNLKAVGHRVVHGGEYFKTSTIVDKEALEKIKACIPLAPLHNPANVLGIERCIEKFPNLPQVAVFDTAFHQTIPKHAYLYALPYEWYEKYSVRRYGFHGTSHQYICKQAAKILGKPLEQSAFITAHLGNGCSVAAILNGKSIDTSMGLTPLEGLVMGTRSGDVDPAIHLYLADHLRMDLKEITTALNKKSGMLGLSGLNMDLREIEEAATKGNERAQIALDINAYRLAKYIGAYAIALGKLDALVFAGGIGENSDIIRSKVIKHLGILGFKLDAKHNATNGRDNRGIITTDDSTIAIVIKTNEELVIARDALQLA